MIKDTVSKCPFGFMLNYETKNIDKYDQGHPFKMALC